MHAADRASADSDDDGRATRDAAAAASGDDGRSRWRAWADGFRRRDVDVGLKVSPNVDVASGGMQGVTHTSASAGASATVGKKAWCVDAANGDMMHADFFRMLLSRGR